MSFNTISTNVVNKSPKVFMLKEFRNGLVNHTNKDLYKLEKVHMYEMTTSSIYQITFHFRNLRTNYIVMGHSSVNEYPLEDNIESSILKQLFSLINPVSGDLPNALYGEIS